MAEQSSALATAHPPLYRQREYMLLWGGMVISAMGAQSSGVIYPLLILALTGSPAQASWAAALRLVPYIVLILPVGAWIDRLNRLQVMMASHLGRCVAVASIPLAVWLDSLTVGHIYAVAVVEGALFVFFNIAETAALPRVVPAQQLPQATGQNQAGWAVTAVAGPALGTWLYQTAGRAWPFVLDVVAHAVGVLALWRMRTDFKPHPPTAPRNLKAEVVEGLRWLWHQPVVRSMSLITGVSNFVQAAVPLLLIVLAQRLGGTDAQVGLIFSMGGLGATLGALVGGWVARRLGFAQVIVGCLAAQALAFPFLAVANSVFWLGLLFGWMMFFGPIYNVVQFSYRLGLIPDGLQGRVNSSFRLIAHGLQPLGAALCGQMLERAGAPWAVAFFAVVLIVLVGMTALDGAVLGAPRQFRA